MKIIFSFALAFVLSLGVLVIPAISPSQPSLSNADAWPTTASNITFYSEEIGSYTYHYCYAGAWPQSYVGDAKNRELESALQDGILSLYYIELGVGNWEIYESQEADGWHCYARGAQTFSTYMYAGAPTYAGKDNAGYAAGEDGDIKWFEVEPVKWYVIDGTNPETCTEPTSIKVISDLVLQSGVPWSNSPLADYYSSNLSNWLHLYFLNQCYTFGSNDYDSGDIHSDPFDYDVFTGDSGEYVFSLLSQEYLTDYGVGNDKYLSSPIGDNSQYTNIAGYTSDFALANECSFMPSNIMLGVEKRPTFTWYSSMDKYDDSLLYVITSSGFNCQSNSLFGGADYHSCGIRPCVSLLYTPGSAQPFDSNLSKYPGITKSTSTGVYNITDFTGLEAMSDFTNAGGTFNKTTDVFRLATNIDCTGKTFVPIKSFNATFDGRGFCIIGLKVTTGAASFIEEMVGGAMKNVNFLDCEFSSKVILGAKKGIGIIGVTSGDVTLNNIYRTGDTLYTASLNITGQINLGGLVGGCLSGQLTIDSCAVVGLVQSTVRLKDRYPGGFVGSVRSENITISNSYFSGKIVNKDVLISLFCGESGSMKGCYLNFTGFRKIYYSGFKDSLWTCKLNSTGPVLKWNLAVAARALTTTESVEKRLIELGFTAAT